MRNESARVPGRGVPLRGDLPSPREGFRRLVSPGSWREPRAAWGVSTLVVQTWELM